MRNLHTKYFCMKTEKCVGHVCLSLLSLLLLPATQQRQCLSSAAKFAWMATFLASISVHTNRQLCSFWGSCLYFNLALVGQVCIPAIHNTSTKVHMIHRPRFIVPNKQAANTHSDYRIYGEK